jgi:hypothetical protein
MNEDDTASERCPICDKKECQKHLLARFDASGDEGQYGIGLAGGPLYEEYEIEEVLYRARLAWVQSVRATGKPKAPRWILAEAGLHRYFETLGPTGGSVDFLKKYESDEEAATSLPAESDCEWEHAREDFLWEVLSEYGYLGRTEEPFERLMMSTTYLSWWADKKDGQANVVGGTQWLWARPDAQDAVDVLFVDEAGQMSLANVLAASQGTASVVLLGDPQQLEQPQQGIHPEGADASALEHVLQGQKTISEDRGIFLPETWRLAPSICAFTSEVFYESKLHARAGLENQVLVGTAPFEGNGLWLVSVRHEGNQTSSLEEVEVIDKILVRLLQSGARWIDSNGDAHDITSDDVLIIAPYNSQVSLLIEQLGNKARIGTVDKFQGQQAPITIYSMATSIPEDAPRGMEFLYSLNRLNVATSRARCTSILVASPRLFEHRSAKVLARCSSLTRSAVMSSLLDL